MRMLRCIRNTALLYSEDHRQDHEQRPGDDPLMPAEWRPAAPQ
ncbi:hypothetical protein ABZ820_22515 [Streptomyces diacarni]